MRRAAAAINEYTPKLESSAGGAAAEASPGRAVGQ